MRIAYLINQYPAISHSFIRREIMSLERQNHNVLRISVRGWDQDHKSKDDQIEQAKTLYILKGGPVPIILAFLRILMMEPMRMARALKLVWNLSRRADHRLALHVIYLLEACQVLIWLHEQNVTHLHAHFGTNPAEVAMLVRELGGPRWSFTAHGPEEFDRAPLISLPEKIRRSDFVVAVSSFGRSQLYRLVSHQSWHKIKVVHCGIEPAFFAGAPEEIGNQRRLVCVGRLCEQKGQFLLVEATRALAARGLEFELVLAGDGEMRSELEALIEAYDLSTIVRITGWISSEQVRDEILAARAMVLPSFAEGLPVVIMEAMALSRPVISTFVAGIPELVQSGEHGWLVPAGDVEALANAMHDCLAAPAENIRHMGASAKSAVLARHNVDTEVSKLIGLIVECDQT